MRKVAEHMRKVARLDSRISRGLQVFQPSLCPELCEASQSHRSGQLVWCVIRVVAIVLCVGSASHMRFVGPYFCALDIPAHNNHPQNDW